MSEHSSLVFSTEPMWQRPILSLTQDAFKLAHHNFSSKQQKIWKGGSYCKILGLRISQSTRHKKAVLVSIPGGPSHWLHLVSLFDVVDVVEMNQSDLLRCRTHLVLSVQSRLEKKDNKNVVKNIDLSIFGQRFDRSNT